MFTRQFQHLSGGLLARRPKAATLFILSLSIVSVLCALANTALAAETKNEFPGRKIYPEIKIIELQDLKKRLADVKIVDVRSAYEYQTLRIKDAINIQVSSNHFADDIANLRSTTDKDIVFYCNGKTCMKSYKAAEKCVKARIKGVLAFDAGIMDWAKTYPGDAELLGKPLRDPKLLIGKSQFNNHLLEPDQFSNKVADEKTIVLDVRDSFQRDALAIFPGQERRVYLDQTKKLDRYIKRAKEQGAALLIYDAAGKQVRWLQYYLEYKRVPNYFFMKGGARAYYSQITDSFLKK